MTSTQLAAIDAAIAEKVMGWHRGVEGPLKYVWLAKPDDRRGIAVIEYWHPTRDFACAWEVAEALLKEFEPFQTFHLHYSADNAARGTPWFCLLASCGPGWDLTKCQALAATAPLAICLAALKAKNLEIPT